MCYVFLFKPSHLLSINIGHGGNSTLLTLQNGQGTAEELDDEDREVQEVTGDNDAESTDMEHGSTTAHHSDRATHHQLIHPNDVLKALRAFVEDHKAPPK